MVVTMGCNVTAAANDDDELFCALEMDDDNDGKKIKI